MKYKLNEWQNQKIFDERLQNNVQSIINYWVETREAHCRICNFRCRWKDSLKKAKKHAEETGHTIDVRSESHKEINYFNKQ